MNINEEMITYKEGMPWHAKLCRISATEPHFHSHALELIYCLEGSIDLVAGHQSNTIKAGEIFSLDFRDIHYLHSEQDNLVLLVHLDLKELDTPWEFLQYVFFACESCHCYPYQQPAMDQIKDILLSMAYDLSSNKNAGTDAHRNAANTLMSILLKYFNWYNYENQDDYINTEIYNRFHRLIGYCNENYMNKISISHLAEIEHVNKNYFSQFVSKTVFEKFSHMVNFIRCYEAEQLLLKTDMPVAEVSFACGFSDPKYFYSAFKFWWECTPTEHRSRYRKYMKTDFHEEVLPDSEAASLIRQHITRWHLYKTFK